MINRDVSDESLVISVRQNDLDAGRILFDRYFIFLRAQLRKYHSAISEWRIDVKIMEVELLDCFFIALATFEQCNGFFYGFWVVILHRQISLLLTRQRRYIYKDNEMIQLDESVDDDSGKSALQNHEIVAPHVDKTTEIGNEIIYRISDTNDVFLSIIEKTILAYYCDGQNLSNIAKLLGKPLCNIRRNFKSALKKLKDEYMKSS